MKTILLTACLLNIFLNTLFCQNNQNNEINQEDKWLIGIVKVYTDTETMYCDVVYADSSFHGFTGHHIYDIIADSYIRNMPLLRPDMMTKIFVENILRYRIYYEKLFPEIYFILDEFERFRKQNR